MSLRLTWVLTKCAAITLTTVSSISSFAQVAPGAYQSKIAAARRDVAQTDQLIIRDLDLGVPHPGKNVFTAVARNNSNDTLSFGLDLRAMPGLWLGPNVQRQFLFQLAPHEERQIGGEYEFARLSEDATLRVRFFFPDVRTGGITKSGKAFFEKRYAVGRDNPADDFNVAKLFDKLTSDHFTIYCAHTLRMGAKLEAVAAEREMAYAKISEILGVASPQPIWLVFYADAETKTRDTGHTGDGLAYDERIIEVYGKVDPFHELVHVLAGQLGDPPAIFDEGLAVYISELMGADALKDLGSPGMKIDEAVAAHFRQNNFIPLEALFTFTDIGPDASKPAVSYPEAASFVKFLLWNWSFESFRRAYRDLKNTDETEGIQKNKEAFHRIYGKYPSELEADWIRSLTATAR